MQTTFLRVVLRLLSVAFPILLITTGLSSDTLLGAGWRVLTYSTVTAREDMRAVEYESSIKD